MVLLSVCIPTYNRAHRLKELLHVLMEEISSLNGIVEVVVSDNCSTDETQKITKVFENNESLKYFRNRHNIGITNNIMLVASLATGKFCWIIGDDDIPKIGAVSRLLTNIRQNPEAGLFVLGFEYVKTFLRHKVLAKHTNSSINIDTRRFFNLGSCIKTIDTLEEALCLTNIAGGLTSIPSCVFSREHWLEESTWYEYFQKDPPLSSFESTFPYAITWINIASKVTIVLDTRSYIYFFIGDQEWFNEKWNAILLSYVLYLGDYLVKNRQLTPSSSVYSDPVLNNKSIYLTLLNRNGYAMRIISLPYLINKYGDSRIFRDNLNACVMRYRHNYESLATIFQIIYYFLLYHPKVLLHAVTRRIKWRMRRE